MNDQYYCSTEMAFETNAAKIIYSCVNQKQRRFAALFSQNCFYGNFNFNIFQIDLKFGNLGIFLSSHKVISIKL